MNLKSDFVKQHFETGNQLKEAGDLEGAIRCYQDALTAQPDRADIQSQLAEVYYAKGKLTEAIATCHQVLRHQPTYAPAYKTLGNALQAQGKIEAAIRAYAKALEVDPNFVPAYVNLGSMFYKVGQLDLALTYYQKAISIQPNLAAAYWNLGKVLEQKGHLEEALNCQQKALELQPDVGGVTGYLNLGNAWLGTGNLGKAIANYQKAVQLQPDRGMAYFLLGNAWLESGQFEQAIEHYQRAIHVGTATDPQFDRDFDLAGVYCNLAIALLQQGKQQGKLKPERLNQTIGTLQKALELNPDLIETHRAWFDLLATAWAGDTAFLREVLARYSKTCGKTGEILAATAFVSLHLQAGLTQLAKQKFLELESLVYQKGNDLLRSEIEALYAYLLFDAPHLCDRLKANLKLFKFIGQKYVQNCLALPSSSQPTRNNVDLKPPANPIHPSSHLKIGFISNHFYRHSVGWCSFDVIRELAKITPHLYCYVTSLLNSDDLTAKFQEIATNFYIPKHYPNGFANPRELSERISQDEIDILVDLDSLTVPIHASILHRQPAPICISWLGFEAPFVSENNYFLCDSETHPEGMELHYKEKLIRVSGSAMAVSGFQTLQTDRDALRKAWRISPEQVVYLCVAAGRKLNPELIRAQIKILSEVPGSVLFYKGKGEAEVIQSSYQQECQLQGVSFHRIKFIDWSATEEEHRTIYLLADILLDSYPYNGGTHTLEALWFHVPTVTRVGEQYLSRMGYSCLKNLGIEAGIAYTWNEYESWGIRMGQDANLRQTIKKQLAQSKQPENLAPLWNPKKLAQDMYLIFQGLLWKKKGWSYQVEQNLVI